MPRLCPSLSLLARGSQLCQEGQTEELAPPVAQRCHPAPATEPGSLRWLRSVSRSSGWVWVPRNPLASPPSPCRLCCPLGVPFPAPCPGRREQELPGGEMLR